MFYRLRCCAQWFGAFFLTLFGFVIWFDLRLVWILVKWVHGLFYKRKYGCKPYVKLRDNLPPYPNFGKLFKVPPKRKSVYMFGQWWYNR